ncbi:Interferon alpha/beta receptor 2 [Collichthys lucidus]|uniref:Interferon alpha/beta receptor 2 n=1 Tax=Collichthys lucidus TaxID=240159 RepID=A0A4V6AM92_COLLU|nr:Interferon alpha/beta receptor 2 [Collichthys lucidus]
MSYIGIRGPGTPPGTQYHIFRQTRKNKYKLLTSSTTTSVMLKLKNQREMHDLTVEASYNHTRSPKSHIYSFTPYEQTIIGPPTLSLAGCGNCIQINISLPEPDRSSEIEDIHSFYGVNYRVVWKKFNGEPEGSYLTVDKRFTLPSLQNGTEYCIQVTTITRQNKNTEASAWTCTYTSTAEPDRGTVVALLILAFGGLMTFVLCLQYTGFICKLKANLPRALAALSQGYTLTPERTIPDHISISPEMEKQRRHNNPTMQHRGVNSEEEEEEDEEEGMNAYMERDAELSCSESSCQNSGDVNRTLAASGDSGTVEVEEPEFEVIDEELGQDEGKADVAEVSFISGGGQTRVQGHVTGVGEEEEKKEVFDSSGNVDLFSVKLASLPEEEVKEEKEEEEEAQKRRDSFTDLLKLSDLEPLLLTVSQPESDDQTAAALTLPSQEDCAGRRADTLSVYLKTCDDETQHEKTQEEEEEEEEEEEFSGYMKHT